MTARHQIASGGVQSRQMTPFHLAFPVHDLDETRRFYIDLLGCRVGRQSEAWIDFDFFGHQITAHRIARDPGEPAGNGASNPVDGKDVPVPHFGAVLQWEAWHAMAKKLREAGVAFLIEPHIRFAGQVGEQATMFMADPSGNYIELKSLKDPALLFATE